MSYVTILCTIQVWRFFVMCQGIMNNPVYVWMFAQTVKLKFMWDSVTLLQLQHYQSIYLIVVSLATLSVAQTIYSNDGMINEH
jgi:hypothetical protein